MPAVHVRELPAEVVAALKRRAARNQRSLEGELRLILTGIAREEATSSQRPLELKLSHTQPTSGWGREDIYRDDGR